MQVDDPIDLTVDPRDLLPQPVVDGWLPHEEESVLHLFQFNQYPPHPSQYILPSNLQPFLHQAPIQEFNYQSLLHIAPPTMSSISKAYQDEIKKSKDPILSVTLIPCHGDQVILPVWVFNYWTEIGCVVKIRKQWKDALKWVQGYSTLPLATDLCYRLLLGLSSLSWSQAAAYTGDITPLLSNSSRGSYLSSYHIDHMVTQIGTQYKAQHGPDAASCHIFATVDHFNAIYQFYSKIH